MNIRTKSQREIIERYIDKIREYKDSWIFVIDTDEINKVLEDIPVEYNEILEVFRHIINPKVDEFVVIEVDSGYERNVIIETIAKFDLDCIYYSDEAYYPLQICRNKY